MPVTGMIPIFIAYVFESLKEEHPGKSRGDEGT